MFGTFRDVLVRLRMFKDVLGLFETFGTFWDILGCCGTFGMYWDVLGCFGMF